MAEFQDTMKEWRRMCKMFSCGECPTCDECPLCEICTSIPASHTDAEIATLEEIVMQWAAEHPEPVYPTWGEWFIQRGELVEGWYNATNPLSIVARCDDVFDKPIPADIAQKLGLKPREDTCNEH